MAQARFAAIRLSRSGEYSEALRRAAWRNRSASCTAHSTSTVSPRLTALASHDARRAAISLASASPSVAHRRRVVSAACGVKYDGCVRYSPVSASKRGSSSGSRRPRKAASESAGWRCSCMSYPMNRTGRVGWSALYRRIHATSSSISSVFQTRNITRIASRAVPAPPATYALRDSTASWFASIAKTSKPLVRTKCSSRRCFTVKNSLVPCVDSPSPTRRADPTIRSKRERPALSRGAVWAASQLRSAGDGGGRSDGSERNCVPSTRSDKPSNQAEPEPRIPTAMTME